MENEFKNFVHAGIELAAAVSEKFEHQIQELVKKGKLSKEEGKKMVDDLLDKSKEKKHAFEERFQEFKQKFSKKTDEEEIERLRKKIEDLEAKVAANRDTGL